MSDVLAEFCAVVFLAIAALAFFIVGIPLLVFVFLWVLNSIVGVQIAVVHWLFMQ